MTTSPEITPDIPEAGFDPRTQEAMQCPFPHFARLREEGPVHQLPGEWVGRPGEQVFVLARHDIVVKVLADWHTFSSRFGTPGAAPPPHLLPRLKEIAATGQPRVATMLTADPPEHTRYRKLVSKAFTPRRVAELTPTITRICQDLTEALGPEAELLDEFCVPIPTKSIAAALGVPEERYADFKRWADASIAPIGRQLDDQGWIDSAEGVAELQRYFAAEFEDRRANPSDDLLSDLAAARLTPEDGVEGEPLSMAEMISIVQQLQVAGSETTASLIADAVLILADQPETWERLAEDPASATPVVEECLRLASPNQGLFRIVTTDTELGGVPIPAGSTIWVLFGSANRDGETYEDPDGFHPERPHVAQHLAFGRGIHYCIGAPLARLEATIGLATLAQRFSKVEPIDRETLEYAPSCILRGLTSLPVRTTLR